MCVLCHLQLTLRCSTVDVKAAAMPSLFALPSSGNT
jgi:hypothetical protein